MHFHGNVAPFLGLKRDYQKPEGCQPPFFKKITKAELTNREWTNNKYKSHEKEYIGATLLKPSLNWGRTPKKSAFSLRKSLTPMWGVIGCGGYELPNEPKEKS